MPNLFERFERWASEGMFFRPMIGFALWAFALFAVVWLIWAFVLGILEAARRTF